MTACKTRLDKLCARRHQHYKNCKVNGIPLPFAAGGFKSVQDEEEVPAVGSDAALSTPLTSIEVNSLDTDVAQTLYARENDIEIDFDELSEVRVCVCVCVCQTSVLFLPSLLLANCSSHAALAMPSHRISRMLLRRTETL